MLGRRETRTRIFFATDIHGSERCFRKWLNAARVYEVQVLILGGDITGKVLVPVVRNRDGVWQAEIHGQPVRAANDSELQELLGRIRSIGRYDVLLSEEEKVALDEDPKRLESVFRAAMSDSLRRWIALADERLADLNVASFSMLGNDDYPEFADILRASRCVTYAEDGIAELSGGFELLSFGFSSPTPWNAPRELPEAELAERLQQLTSQLYHPAQAVFNLHCPPQGTHLDQAPKLDRYLRPVVDATGLQQASVGSWAVRRAIERNGPLLGLHGHVHESPGAQRLGPTLCINPGSDYGDGILRGAIVELERGQGVRRWQLVQG